MLTLNKKGFLGENQYDLSNDPQNSTLFGTGNGYFGVRGSLEEFGAVFIQGCYVRGVFDSIIEIPITFVDNEYMKKYYFDEQKLKEFEYEDSCINIADITHLRIKIGNNYFYPWEGKVLSWERYIDTNDGSLVRNVIWDDGYGNETSLEYRRFASFADNHLYVVTCKIKRLNHKLEINIESGIDTFVKTNGQKKSKILKIENEDVTYLTFEKMPKYKHQVAISYQTEIDCNNEFFKESIEKQGIIYDNFKVNDDEIFVCKKVYLTSNVDYGNIFIKKLKKESNKLQKINFNEIYNIHLVEYKRAFDKIDIKITGNDDLDGHLRYANYQTLIGFDRYDMVHSLSAKNLTAEKYNQFVWWDCEIYQAPIFYATFPKESESLLMYRYNRLNAAKENAKLLGEKGAKYAFCSSVLGDENVWSYARHPFLQIHINSDIAYSNINYYNHTNNKDFFIKYGLPVNIEILRYFANKLEFNNNVYNLNNVTGTDEHHPYINNNAYTNYTVQYVFDKTLYLMDKFNIDYKDYITEEEYTLFNDIKEKMYLPLNENGMIPQFDGYFDLSQDLEVEGKGAGTSFQMKQGGLYHKSQVIKQPDVLVLFSYLNIPVPGNYKNNFIYYENICESSSSLTYPVHAICAIDNHDEEKFFDYLDKSIKIDIVDLHKGAYQGVHAAAMAGGWYAIYRGLLGIEQHENELIINPKKVTKLDKVELNFTYHGIDLNIVYSNNEVVIKSKRLDNPINIKIKNTDKVYEHLEITVIKND
mgnify:CR=1 FL=1